MEITRTGFINRMAEKGSIKEENIEYGGNIICSLKI